MSRDPDDYTDDARRTAVALERIADTLDDYIEMTMTLTEMQGGLRTASPEAAAALKPLTDAIDRIRERRSLPDA